LFLPYSTRLPPKKQLQLAGTDLAAQSKWFRRTLTI
jgi:hypothetical protein